MRKRLTVFVLGAVLAVLSAAPALAGSPHFVGTPTLVRDGDTLTVAGKVAGLGNETQIRVTLTADAQCVNPGSNEPQAENKGAVLASGTFPVQNGKANFTLSGTGFVDPSSPCPDPQTLAYSNVTVTVSDTSFEPFSFTFAGTF